MKPNYYAVIPAEVRYNEKLTANSKLLYGEITALSNKKGMCWATNKYFADLYNVSEVSVSKWVSQLIDQALIRTQTNHDGKREIYLIGVKEKFKGVQRKVKGGVKEKFKPNNNIHNNNNNTSNNSATFKKVSEFSDFYINAYEHILNLFPEEFHPKDTKIKVDWLNVIRLADQKDKVNPRQLYYLIKKAKQDNFWKGVNFGLLSLRKTNSKSGLRRIDQFKLQFGGDEFSLLANKPNNDK
jgi:hypothetical protein